VALTKANVVSFVQLLAHSKGDDTNTLNEFFDDTMERYAKTTAPYVETYTFNIVSGTSVYAYPSAAVRILAVFHDGKFLPFTPPSNLEMYSSTWRTDTGDPVAWTSFEQDSRNVRMVPEPDANSTNGGVMIYGENRTTDIQDWLVMPQAFEMLYEEFFYPSDHQDKEFAFFCFEIAQTFRALVRL
jgi:hypothetical protein